MGGLVWLASYPKSGNTWTRNFLHNILRGDGEGSFDINKMNTLTTWDSGMQWYKPLLDKPLEDCTKEEVAAVRIQANQRMADATPDLVFVKTHNAMVADRGVPMVNSKVTAGAVYIVRNPLDVAISYSHHLNKTIDETINFMNLVGFQSQNRDKMAYEVQSSWLEHVYSWTRKENPSLFVMRYEDMLVNPLKEFGKLIKFLRIRTPRRVLEEAIEASSFKKLKEQEDEKGFGEKPKDAKSFFRTGKSDQWKDTLNKDQIEEIIRVNREQMARFHYLPQGY
ncbi:MAG: sulfotransferase domain-containing protein [Nitrospinae bacterium]|nr:sulfotransferase domain-containing protein [Nitrospinota bacterium]